jgi:hypothetical protein
MQVKKGIICAAWGWHGKALVVVCSAVALTVRRYDFSLAGQNVTTYDSQSAPPSRSVRLILGPR